MSKRARVGIDGLRDDKFEKYENAINEAYLLLVSNDIPVPSSIQALVDRPDAPAEPDHYCMELMHQPNFSRFTTRHKFPKLPSLKGAFPHSISKYYFQPNGLELQVESRRPVALMFRLVGEDEDRHCTERDLLPDEENPRVFFHLKLVYADSDKGVTLEGLGPTANSISTLTSPDVIHNPALMVDGRVYFFFKSLNVLSSMTTPTHRQFRFKLVCADPHVRDIVGTICSFPFYSVSRVRGAE